MRSIFKIPPLNFLAILHDATMAALSFFLALYLRLGERTFAFTQHYLLEGMAVFVVLQLGLLLGARAYRHLWRYTALTDLIVIARTASVALLIFYLGLFGFTRLENMPRSVPFIHWMTLMLCLMSGRVAWRLIHDRALIARLLGRAADRVDVLLIGASPEAEMFIRESARNADFPYRVVGLVDDDPRQHGREIQHIRIYGSMAEIGYILRKLERKGRRPKRLVIAVPQIDRLGYETLMSVAQAHNLSIARLPSISELKAGDRVHDIRAVAVEDILGRDEAVLDRPGMRALIAGKRVLITGAGGSIGAELTRQIAALNPAEILLFEQSEYQLYLIDEILRDLKSGIPHQTVIGDIRDQEQLSRSFAQFRPEIVFHAAAIKHVPLAEANPDQAVLTNILGSKQVADACVAHKVGVMVQISTDKAVNPSSVMGATKRAAEIYCQMLSQDGAATRFVTVRFGNVLNSTGSVVPLFQRQIARGGPVTVTHKEMTRYFMSISEAVQLVLQAAVLGDGDRAPIFVLDMGEPVRIEELACQMIRLAGLKPYEDINIVFTGLRPGEKLFEELFHDAESMLPTRHRLIHLARARTLDRLEVLAAVRDVIAAAHAGNNSEIPGLLRQIVKRVPARFERRRMKIARALLSLSDKTGLLPFAQFLAAQGIELVSTGGTAVLLREHNIPVREVSDLTQFPEMMDGRVKTLHPAVHGGLLARRDDPEHMGAARAHAIGMIDLLVVTLYPFETMLNQTADRETLFENIDIGGPAMIRSAAKNHESVTVVTDPADYVAVQKALQQNEGEVPLEMRKKLAAKAFARTAAYDTLIAGWLSTTADTWPEYLLDAKLAMPLRYGENPHQKAALYQRLEGKGGIAHAVQLQGKELSYNNLTDAEAAFAIVASLEDPAAAIIKHANPSGAAVAATLIDAFTQALKGDPVSAFGGILAVNRAVDRDLVAAIGTHFLEVIIAPRFEPEALHLLAAKKNLRLLATQAENHASPLAQWMIEPISGGYLVQQQDRAAAPADQWKTVAGSRPTEAQQRDVAFAWHLVKYVKSNAIVLVKNGTAIGIGAGQMSRVDSVRIAIEKAKQHGHDVKGAVLASDAFFPFADNVELAAAAGIGVIVQPGGSMRDEEVIAAANKHAISMLFTGMRHFKH